MAKRRKRLEKSIDSLQKQIEIHKKKRELAEDLGQEERMNYYDKEILSLKKRKEDREEKMDRK